MATPGQAQEVHLGLRKIMAERYNTSIAEVVAIQYGGAEAENAAELLKQPDIDGALVGGASLKVDQFLGIVAGAFENGRTAALGCAAGQAALNRHGRGRLCPGEVIEGRTFTVFLPPVDVPVAFYGLCADRVGAHPARQGGGLAGAFGGMGGQNAFGTKAGDLFTKITIGVATF